MLFRSAVYLYLHGLVRDGDDIYPGLRIFIFADFGGYLRRCGILFRALDEDPVGANDLRLLYLAYPRASFTRP